MCGKCSKFFRTNIQAWLHLGSTLLWLVLGPHAYDSIRLSHPLALPSQWTSRPFFCNSSLHPFGSIGLLLPSISTSILRCGGSTSILRHPGFTLAACPCGYILFSSRNFNVTQSLRVFGSARVSSSTSSVSVRRSPGSTWHPHQSYSMIPPTFDSTIHHGVPAGGYSLAPPAVYSSLATASFISSLLLPHLGLSRVPALYPQPRLSSSVRMFLI